MTEIVPSKIVAVHVSYRSRAMERGSLPPWPSYFLKPPNTVAASGDSVARPPGCELLAFEGEVALIIGRRATRVSPILPGALPVFPGQGPIAAFGSITSLYHPLARLAMG